MPDEEPTDSQCPPTVENTQQKAGTIEEANVNGVWTNISRQLHQAHLEDALASQPELYKAWIRWLHRLTTSSDAGDVFQSEIYWTLLQHGLRPPSAEQRRYCLYILGKSITLLDQSVNVTCFAFAVGDSVFTEAYEKFCTLFSTFVLDRYINQVEECLPELRDLAAPAGQVDPSWIIVLLEAALHHSIQDSVRKAVGDHFMQWSLMGFQETAEWSGFLTRAFLPWSCQGYLFTGSIVKYGSNPRCEHGEQLTFFIARLVHLCSDEDDMLSLSRLLLQYIVDSPKLFPYAGAYILQGLLISMKELAGEREIQFGSEEVDLAARILRRADLPEMGRAAWKAALRGLCQLNRPDPDDLPDSLNTDSSPIHVELDRFRSQQSTSWAATPTTSVTTTSSMQELLALNAPASFNILDDLIKRTHYQCLQREGLIRALAYVERCSTALAAVDESIVHGVILALWTETEIQDYPKAALMRLPGIVLEEEILNMIDPDAQEVCADEKPQASFEPCSEYPAQGDLHALILKIWTDLLRLSHGRIYVFAPLTRALHRLCFKEYGEGCPVGREVDLTDGSTHMHYLYPPARIVPFNDFIIDLSTSPPRSKIEFQLEAAIAQMIDDTASVADTFKRYYGESEAMAYAYVFDLLNRCSFNATSMKHLLDRLLQPWLEQQQPLVIVSKWKHTIQLQLMILVLHHISDASLLSNYFAKFLQVLAIEPMPRYRFLLQWIISAIYSKAESQSRWDQHCGQLASEIGDAIIEPLRRIDHDNPKFIGSLLKIGLTICKMKGRSPSGFPLRFMTAMVAICASPKIVVRHEAQWSFVALWDFAKVQVAVSDTLNQDQWTELISNPVLQSLSEYMQRLDRYTNPPPERLLEEFDFDTDSTLTNLLQGRYLSIDPPEAPLTTREDLINVWIQDGYEVDKLQTKVPGAPNQAEARMRLGEPQIAPSGQSGNTVSEPSKTAATTKSKAPLQTKAASWQTVLDTLNDTALGPSPINRHVRPLIVFASHIASAVNLGGLSRASEVFGAESLVVAKAEVINDKAFLGVSVNSHLHLAINEVKPDEQTVLAWLHQKRRDGYGVVGVEQTDRSKVLGEKRGGEDVPAFPKRCILVMGSEREGIPGWLLAECDAGCVEIPQVGVTRSLNVQTAAAVALYEYGRQHGGRA